MLPLGLGQGVICLEMSELLRPATVLDASSVRSVSASSGCAVHPREDNGRVGGAVVTGVESDAWDVVVVVVVVVRRGGEEE